MPFPVINPALARALEARSYVEPTPVQAAVLETGSSGRDLLVSAQTGSGKTVAFGLAMAETLLGGEERFGRAAEPLALIIAPTRELAMQVHTELAWLYDGAGGRVVSCVGGMDARREQRLLEAGCHIVVGTPGRLRDHLERGRLDISALRAVVLDEADEMLDLGFREDLEFILEATPASRRTLLFSATIAKEIATLARTYQRDALRIDTLVRNQAHGDIDYRAIRVAPTDIDHAVVNVLRFHEARAALVFCHTREAVRHLHASLLERGFAAVALSGELSQGERTHALQALRDGRARVCVATDVAARGLDLPDLGLVIHADLPKEKSTLLHRSGRTGRAGRKGICALLVPFTRRRRVEQLLATANIRATWQDPPSAEEIRTRDQERMVEDPLLNEETTPEDLVLARALLESRGADGVAAALIRLYRSRLPAPEDMFDSQPAGGRGGEDFREGRPRRDDDHRAERSERGERSWRDESAVAGDGPAAWFHMNVGRENNADPKWLIPLICRRGHVTKREIGFIKIFDRETKFEIAAEAAERFWSAVQKSGDQEVRIQPTTPFAKDGGRPNADRLERPRIRATHATGQKEARGDKKPFPADGDRTARRPSYAIAGEKPPAGRPKPYRPKFDPVKAERPGPEHAKPDRPRFERPKFDPKVAAQPGGKVKKKHRKGPSRP